MAEYNLNGILFKDITSELNNGRVTIRANVENTTGVALNEQVVEVTVYNTSRTETFIFEGHLQAMGIDGTDQFNETHETSKLTSVGDLEIAEIVNIPDTETDGIKFQNIRVTNNGTSTSNMSMWIENNTGSIVEAGYYNITLLDSTGTEIIILSKYIEELQVGQEIKIELSSDNLDIAKVKAVNSFKMEKEPIDTEKMRSDVDDLQSGVVEISNELDLAKEDIADLKSNVESVNTEIDTIKSNLSSLESKENAFESSTNTSISNLETKHDTDISRINTKLAELDETDNREKTDIINIQENIDNIESNVQTNANDITTLENRQNALESNLATTNTNVETNKINITNINTNITSMKKDITTNKTDISTLKDNIKDLQTSDNTIKTSIINIQDGQDEAKTAIEGIGTKVTSLETKMAVAEDNIDDLESDVSTIKADLKSIVDKNTEQTISINNLSKDLSTANSNITSIQSDINNLEEADEEINRNVTTLLENDRNINSKVTNNETEIQSIKTQLPQIETNKTNIENLQTSVANLQTNITSLEPRVTSNTTEITLLKTASENTNADILAVKTNITSINDNIGGIEEDLDALEEKHDTDIQGINQSLGEQDDDMQKVQDDLATIFSDIIKIEEKINELQEEENPTDPIDPSVPTSPSVLEKLVADYLKESINNLLCVIIPRHDTSSNWTLNDPILAYGEYGVEDDTHRVKRGDGENKWADLDYETFGIENIIATTAAEISYSNTNTGISKVDVQEVLDYLIENQLSMRQEIDLKEEIRNKAYAITEAKVNDTTFPSTKAVFDYVSGLFTDKMLVPIPPDESRYVLQSENGIMKWVTGASVTGDITILEDKVEDQQREIDALKKRIDELENLNEVEF